MPIPCVSFPHLTVSLPIPCVSFPYLIITLQADLKFGVEQGVDMVFASFIRKAQDVAACREELGEKGKHILIISKVTTPQKLEMPCGTLPHPVVIVYICTDLGWSMISFT